MSQSALAQQLGVTFQQIQKYENGANRISARTLWYVSQILDTDLVSLLPKPTGSKTREAILNSAEFALLGGYFARLNARGRRLLLSTARGFCEDDDLADPKSRKK